RGLSVNDRYCFAFARGREAVVVLVAGVFSSPVVGSRANRDAGACGCDAVLDRPVQVQAVTDLVSVCAAIVGVVLLVEPDCHVLGGFGARSGACVGSFVVVHLSRRAARRGLLGGVGDLAGLGAVVGQHNTGAVHVGGLVTGDGGLGDGIRSRV